MEDKRANIEKGYEKIENLLHYTMEKLDLDIDIVSLFKYDCMNFLNIIYIFANAEERNNISNRVNHIFKISNSNNIMESIINETGDDIVTDAIFAQTPYLPSFLVKTKELKSLHQDFPYLIIEFMQSISSWIIFPDGCAYNGVMAFLLIGYYELEKNLFSGYMSSSYKTIIDGEQPSLDKVLSIFNGNINEFIPISNCKDAEKKYTILKNDILNGKIEGLINKSKKTTKIFKFSKSDINEKSLYIDSIKNYEEGVLIDVSNSEDAGKYNINVESFDWQMVAILLQYAVGEFGEYKKGHYCNEYLADYVVVFSIIVMLIITGESLESIMGIKIYDYNCEKGTININNNNIVKTFKLLPELNQVLIDQLIRNRDKEKYIFDLNNELLLWVFDWTEADVDPEHAENEIAKITNNLLGKEFTSFDLQLFGIKYIYLLTHDAEYISSCFQKENLHFIETCKEVDEYIFDEDMQIQDAFDYLITEFEIDNKLQKKYIKDDSEYAFFSWDSPCNSVIDRWQT